MRAAVCTALALVATGCIHQPYKDGATWLKHDNAIPQYYADYDVFFIHRPGSDWETDRAHLTKLYDDLRQRVALAYGPKVRFFAPLLHDDAAVKETEKALTYYLERFHGGDRPYVVIVTGREAAYVEAFRNACSSDLAREKGCARVQVESSGDYAASAEDVDSSVRAVAALVYERRWHRPSPGFTNP